MNAASGGVGHERPPRGSYPRTRAAPPTVTCHRVCGAPRAVRCAGAPHTRTRNGRPTTMSRDHHHRRRAGGADRRRRLRGGRRGRRRPRGARERWAAAPARRPRRGVAQEGPHAFYVDGPHWQWLVERNLVGPVATFPLRGIRGTWLHRGGRLRRTPPAGLLPLLAHRRRRAPVDVDFHTWASALHGEEAARAAANLVGVVTFDSDPGRLSAAFVWDLLLRVTAAGTPIVRWPVGGWPAVVDRLAGRARELGCGSRRRRGSTPCRRPRSSSRPSWSRRGPCWATTRSPGRADHACCSTSGLVPDRRDAFFVADLDDSGFVERVTGVDPTLAPAGHSLVQADMPVKPGEPRAAALARLEHLLDLGVPGWGDRLAWRRTGRGGPLRRPGPAGPTWRDRPAVDRGDGVFLAGDLVAAPASAPRCR